ncbi:hypothetical protein F5Y04DRAFT_245697 [Hypomontagnella monticulosa]|nr:hypothetical protein F5Y04DRAFT_245697 [Hypomontagnella monticulosa]
MSMSLFLLTCLSFPGALRTNLPIVRPCRIVAPCTPSPLIDPSTHSMDAYAGQSHIACVLRAGYGRKLPFNCLTMTITRW